MAIVDNNIMTKGLVGKVGNLVFRRRNGKTTVYVLNPGTAPPSSKQTENRARFRKAVNLARAAIKIEEERKRFEKMARQNKKESAYSAAISYYMLPGEKS